MTRPEIWLCRHGETEWSSDGRHTSRTDLPLTSAGIDEARQLATRLSGVAFDLVFTSPLPPLRGYGSAGGVPRAHRGTGRSRVGLRRGRGPDHAASARRSRAGRCGPTRCRVPRRAEQVGARADGVIDRCRPKRRPVRCCSRTATSCGCWPPAGSSMPATEGVRLLLDTATLSVLGWSATSAPSSAGIPSDVARPVVRRQPVRGRPGPTVGSGASESRP